MPSYILIETVLAFQALIEELRSSPYIALDTESNSFHAYFERICLVQVSTPSQDYIIDPLVLEDLSALGTVLSNPGVEVIAHAASNDISGLKRDFGFRIANLFDTALAWKVLGHKRLGLATLLEQRFGIRLNKKWQRCDWGKRPLSPEQLDYARLDTHYLIALRHLLAGELQERQLWEKAREVFEKALQQPVQVRAFDRQSFMRINGARLLSETGRRVLEALFLYRDEEARRRDRAPFRVLSNEALLSLARHCPRSVKDFQKIKGLPRSYRKGRSAHELLGVVRTAVEEAAEGAGEAREETHPHASE